MLDFDLSWHKGATEVSILAPSSENGFLAPELLHRSDKMTTRSAAVDAYGIGMTMYFLATCNTPAPSQHLHGNWQKSLDNDAGTKKCTEWTSLPRRFFRMIYESTRHEQTQRIDVSQMFQEINCLHECISLGKNISLRDYAEELLSRTTNSGYDWNRYKGEGSYKLGGLEIRIISNESEQEVKVMIIWRQTGNEEHRRVRDFTQYVHNRISSLFRKGGWKCKAGSGSAYEISVDASVAYQILVERFDECVKTLQSVISEATYD